MAEEAKDSDARWKRSTITISSLRNQYHWPQFLCFVCVYKYLPILQTHIRTPRELTMWRSAKEELVEATLPLLGPSTGSFEYFFFVEITFTVFRMFIPLNLIILA